MLGGYDPAAYDADPHVGHGARRRPGPGRRRAAAGTPLDGTAPGGAVRLRRRTSLACRRGSRSPGCRCSTGASCAPSPTPRAAASSAGGGTCTASCSNKRNTFTDFVAAPSTWWPEGSPRPAGWPSGAGSAGGLLVGAVANHAPTCSGRVVAEVPFVDVRQHHARRRSRSPSPSGRSGATRATRRVDALHGGVLALRERGRRGLPADARHRRPERPACQLPRAGQVGGPAAGARPRATPRSCCTPRWAPATAARRAGTTPGGTRRSSSPSSSRVLGAVSTPLCTQIASWRRSASRGAVAASGRDARREGDQDEVADDRAGGRSGARDRRAEAGARRPVVHAASRADQQPRVNADQRGRRPPATADQPAATTPDDHQGAERDLERTARTRQGDRRRAAGHGACTDATAALHSFDRAGEQEHHADARGPRATTRVASGDRRSRRASPGRTAAARRRRRSTSSS